MALEITLKVLSSVYLMCFLSPKAKILLFAVFSLVANIASLAMLSLLEVDSEIQEMNLHIDIFNLLTIGQLFLRDTWFALMMPYQFVFGFASSYIPFYVFGTIVKSSEALGGDKSIGFFSALVILCTYGTGWLIDWTGLLNNKYATKQILGLSSILLATAGFLLYIYPEDDNLSNLGILVPYIFLYGASRGMWEVTSRRVIAEHFEDSPERASCGFTFVSFFNGFSGAIGYFSFLLLSRKVIDRIIFCFAILSLLCFVIGEFCYTSTTITQRNNSIRAPGK
jgi:hypothetical protein